LKALKILDFCPVYTKGSAPLNSDFISSKNGGDAAVREFIEWIVL
jgi:3-deoxy-D-manno-octulosonate 8-phosphate phosphatase KdsC-like HAD superfamily phosphatase